MVVGCPKCKTRLKIADEKIKPEGTKFKCPKCAILLKVRRPAAKAAAPPPGVDLRKAIVAHERPATVDRLRGLLMDAGYTVFTAADGVSTMVKAMKESPSLAVLDIALPKIHGLEVSRRLKARANTNDMKTLLVSTKGEPKRKAREPVSPLSVDEYVYEDELDRNLLETVKKVFKQKEAPQPRPAAPPPPVSPMPPVKEDDSDIARAKRLSRTILSDIDLYNPDKVAAAVKEGNFQAVFENDLNEGLKLYLRRISEDVRNKGDFYEEAVADFIANKKKALGL